MPDARSPDGATLRHGESPRRATTCRYRRTGGFHPWLLAVTLSGLRNQPDDKQGGPAATARPGGDNDNPGLIDHTAAVGRLGRPRRPIPPLEPAGRPGVLPPGGDRVLGSGDSQDRRADRQGRTSTAPNRGRQRVCHGPVPPEPVHTAHPGRAQPVGPRAARPRGVGGGQPPAFAPGGCCRSRPPCAREHREGRFANPEAAPTCGDRRKRCGGQMVYVVAPVARVTSNSPPIYLQFTSNSLQFASHPHF